MLNVVSCPANIAPTTKNVTNAMANFVQDVLKLLQYASTAVYHTVTTANRLVTGLQ